MFVVDTRWAFVWRMVDGEEDAKARLVAKGFQDPDLEGGSVGTSGCVSLRSSHRRVISLGTLATWRI